jgi:hypothetical protein
MNTEDIIQQIDLEISKLQQAKTLLNGASPTPIKRGAGRPKKSAIAARILAVKPTKKTRGPLSAEGKAKIANAQKLRWAKVRRAAKKASHAAAAKPVAKTTKPTPATPAKAATATKTTPVKS